MALILAIALVPIFFGLLLGYFAGLSRMVDNQHVHGLVSFVMNFALPCALFLAILKATRAMLLAQGRLMLVLAAVYLLVYALMFLASRRLMRESASDSAVLSLTVAFPNVTAVGIPLLESVYGPQTAVTVAIAIAVGAMTISPLTLSILESGTASGRAMAPGKRLRRAVLRAVRRPVVWAPALAVLFVLANVVLPVWAVRSLSVMGSATAGAALFVTGLIVSAQPFALDWRVVGLTVVKNMFQPLACLGLGMAVALPPEQLRNAVLLTAIPCGFFGLVFGKGFRASPRTASASLIVSYAVGILTLAAWIVVLRRLA